MKETSMYIYTFISYSYILMHRWIVFYAKYAYKAIQGCLRHGKRLPTISDPVAK